MISEGEKITRFFPVEPGKIVEIPFYNYLSLHNYKSEINLEITESLIK